LSSKLSDPDFGSGSSLHRREGDKSDFGVELSENGRGTTNADNVDCCQIFREELLIGSEVGNVGRELREEKLARRRWNLSVLACLTHKHLDHVVIGYSCCYGSPSRLEVVGVALVGSIRCERRGRVQLERASSSNEAESTYTDTS
jgi:hypothetical protein